jgi:Glutamine amidotransferase class-I
LSASHADRGTVLVVQHVACETLGTIEHALRAQLLTHRYVRVHEGDPISSRLNDSCGLIVMGGPMSVHESERLPHLVQEMRLIESALADHRPVLGVCLGSQLLAQVLGSKVSAGPRKEIGWHRVRLNELGPARCTLGWRARRVPGVPLARRRVRCATRLRISGVIGPDGLSGVPLGDIGLRRSVSHGGNGIVDRQHGRKFSRRTRSCRRQH